MIKGFFEVCRMNDHSEKRAPLLFTVVFLFVQIKVLPSFESYGLDESFISSIPLATGSW